MKKVVSYLGKAIVCCTTSLLAITSCEEYINEDYDLTKDIDLTVNLLQGLSAPVGNVSKVSVTDLLEMDLVETDLIKADEKGDLSIQYGDVEHFEIDKIDFGSWERQTFEPINIGFPLSRFNLSGYQIPGTILSYSQLMGAPFSVSTSTHFETEIPEQITGIEYVDFFTDVVLSFSTTQGKAYLKSGLKIHFPEYVLVQNYYDYPEFVVEDGNTIVLVKDMPTPADLKFLLNRIALPEEAFAEGRIVLDLEVGFEGDVYVNTDDFTDLSQDINITVSTNDILLKPTSASVRINAEIEPAGTEIVIPDLPDFLAEGNVCVDLYDPALYLAVDNWTDFQFGLEAEITAHQSSMSPSVSLGTDPQICIERQSTHKYLISSREKDVEDNVVNIVRPSFRDMFREIPERISIDDMKLKLNSGEGYFHFNLGVSYQVDYEYMLTLPLAFGENLNFNYDYDIDLKNIKFSTMIDQAIMTLDLVNSIPLAFDLDVEAIDYNGNPVEGVNLDVDAKIASGTHDSPVTTPVTLNLSTTEESISLGGIRLKLSVSAPAAEHLGVALNMNQGIELKDVSLSIPSGVTFNIENF